MLILNSQQLYLQKSIYNEMLVTQIKLFETIKGKYDISNSFKQKTGLSIREFLFIMKLFWIRIDSASFGGISFYSYFEDYVLKLFEDFVEHDKLKNFIQMLTLDEYNPQKDIEKFSRIIRNDELQDVRNNIFYYVPISKI